MQDAITFLVRLLGTLLGAAIGAPIGWRIGWRCTTNKVVHDTAEKLAQSFSTSKLVQKDTEMLVQRCRCLEEQLLALELKVSELGGKQ